MIDQIQALPVTAELSKIVQYVREGWPTHFSEECKPYSNRKAQPSTESDCLLWGNRVVVPLKLRSRLVEELHHDHPGVT